MKNKKGTYSFLVFELSIRLLTNIHFTDYFFILLLKVIFNHNNKLSSEMTIRRGFRDCILIRERWTNLLLPFKVTFLNMEIMKELSVVVLNKEGPTPTSFIVFFGLPNPQHACMLVPVWTDVGVRKFAKVA